jgi:hypothetical protein
MGQSEIKREAIIAEYLVGETAYKKLRLIRELILDYYICGY